MKTFREFINEADILESANIDYSKFPNEITVAKTHYQVKSGLDFTTYIKLDKYSAEVLQKDQIAKSKEYRNGYLTGSEKPQEFVKGTTLKLKPSSGSSFARYEGKGSSMVLSIRTLWQYKRDGLIDFDPPLK